MNETSAPAWPPTKGVKGWLILFLMKLSFLLRVHPMRFLYSDRLLKLVDSGGEDVLASYFRRKWDGPMWDVGASVGKYTVMMAKANPDRTIYAFEPNINSLYYLAYRTAQFPNVVIVPCALTADGQPFKTSYSADFMAAPTGPLSHSISLAEAVAKFGKPAFAKFDIEGGEYFVFKNQTELLAGSHLLIEWHKYKFTEKIPDFPNSKVSDAVPDDGILVTRYYEPG